MGAYFAYDYAGSPFEQWGVAHIGALLVIAGLVLALGKFLPRGSYPGLRIALALLLAVNELFWHAWHVYHGLWSVQQLLPLNICNLMVINSIWVLLTRNQIGYEFLYLLGIPAASQVLITPALGRYGFPHVLFFQIFISHGGIIVAALYLTFTERMRPLSWQSLQRVIVWTTGYAVVIFFLNFLLKSNYLFLAHKPPAATLLDYLGAWPWYIFAMEGIGITLVILLYLPFHFAKSVKTLGWNNGGQKAE